MERRAQSAMEYLMTYGWAILIIAVVLGALFGLGFFNSANLAPKVGPGACQVYRPNGPGTTSFVNLEGTCNNELPQYVAHFNGQSSSVSILDSSNLDPGSQTDQITVSAWIYVSSYGAAATNGIVVKDISGSIGNPPYGLTLSGGQLQFSVVNSINSAGGATYSQLSSKNSWYYAAGTYDGNNIIIYLNGVKVGTGNLAGPIATTAGTLNIGQQKFGANRFFNGSIADVQIYNASLSANEITALYDEGIGGVPIVPNKLVGWWPLNGNANDYSGNLNNGVTTNVVYSSSWTSGYTAP